MYLHVINVIMPLRSECSPDACVKMCRRPGLTSKSPRFDPWRRKIFDDESEIKIRLFLNHGI
jgi:hypothetical protein